MSFLNINEKGQLVVSNPEILYNKAFKILADSDMRLLLLVWWVADNRSPIKKAGYPINDRILKVCHKLGIDTLLVDDNVHAAIKEYEELNTSLAAETLTSIRSGMRASISVVNKTTESLNNWVQVEFDDTRLKQLNNHIELMLDKAKKLSDVLESLKKAEINFEQEQDNGKKRQGGKPIAPSALAD